MNTEKKFSEQIKALEEASRSLQAKLYESVYTFDIFVTLLSSTIWQSPIELANIWIEGVSPDIWNLLKNKPYDTKEVLLKKSEHRKMILNKTGLLIYKLANNPTIFQQISTRILVRDTLVERLPATDQDRIIATESHIHYKTWQRILSVFALYPELRNILETSTYPLKIEIDSEGKDTCNVITENPTEVIEEIPGVMTYTMDVTSRLEITGTEVSYLWKKMTITHISHNVLKRCDDVIGGQDEKQAIRKIILDRFYQIPAWKKRGSGGNKPKDTRAHEGEFFWK